MDDVGGLGTHRDTRVAGAQPTLADAMNIAERQDVS
jgi:hypothetical protein